ncbi:MAG: nitrite reductase (NAD(P)H) small subunit [Candidatus Kapabacteria bacterium]|nr:nitrite reductase (NAD(P)H) small subunit [Ignavibacteriota bacterium]MCW5884134.1 nitrite reductase (NAD(P)H) small subunit [Candidatus Kapabacteria bacterium]
MININNTVNFEGKEYLRVCSSEEVYEGKGRQILFDGDEDFQLAVFRVKGRLYALDNICPHRHADRIFEGIIKDLTVMCPLHGWTYSLDNGQNVNSRQGIKSLKNYEVFEKDNDVYVQKPEFEVPKWRR